MWDSPPYRALSAGLKLRNVANGTSGRRDKAALPGRRTYGPRHRHAVTVTEALAFAQKLREPSFFGGGQIRCLRTPPAAAAPDDNDNSDDANEQSGRRQTPQSR